MDGRAVRDAELVARAREGDLDAFERLLARHRTRLLDLARRLVPEREAAQDIVQEALVRAFRFLPSLREPERFGAWLNTTVRRLGQEWLRDGPRRPEPLEGELLQGAPAVLWAPPPAPPEEVVERVRAALAVLSRRERQAMILHYLEGRSCEEIAHSLGLSNAGVRRLLHYSRRKARKESDAMAEAERKGPRRMKVWINGSVPRRRNVFDYLKDRVLNQSICLAANKEARSPAQLAAQVGAHEEYVREAISDLEWVGALQLEGKGRYAAAFIAMSAGDWRRLVKGVSERAAQVAERFAAAQDDLCAAFAQTPLAASGWRWEDVTWVIHAVLLANDAIQRQRGPVFPEPDPPERPDGGTYWLGGREETPGLPVPWLTGLSSSSMHSRLTQGTFWTWQIHWEEVHTVSDLDDRGPLVDALAEGPQSEEALLARAGEERERARAALADLVAMQYVRRANGQYRLNLPVLTQEDSAILKPVLDRIAAPVFADVVAPALEGFHEVMDSLGYSRLRDQYPAWRRWHATGIAGESLRFLMEQGVLPRVPDPAPQNFGTLLWEPGAR